MHSIVRVRCPCPLHFNACLFVSRIKALQPKTLFSFCTRNQAAMVVPQSAPDVMVSWPKAKPQATPCGMNLMEPPDGQTATSLGPSLHSSSRRAGPKKTEPKGTVGCNPGQNHRGSGGNSSQAKLRARGLCCTGNRKQNHSPDLQWERDAWLFKAHWLHTLPIQGHL